MSAAILNRDLSLFRHIKFMYAQDPEIPLMGTHLRETLPQSHRRGARERGARERGPWASVLRERTGAMESHYAAGGGAGAGSTMDGT